MPSQNGLLDDMEELKRQNVQEALASSKIGAFTQLAFTEKLRADFGIIDAEKNSAFQNSLDVASAANRKVAQKKSGSPGKKTYMAPRDRVRFHHPDEDLVEKLAGARPCWEMQQESYSSSEYGRYENINAIPTHQLYYWPSQNQNTKED